MTKNTVRTKNRGCIIALIVMASILVCIALFVGVIAIINSVYFDQTIDMIASIESVGHSLEPTLDLENNSWTFVTDDDFKVMQLTDIHIGAGAFSKKRDISAINAVATLVQAEKPDLVIITGDMAYPVPYQSGTLGNKREATVIATLMEQLDVYWAVIFGNHDSEAYSYYSRKAISEFYSDDRWEHCLYLEGEQSVDGYGNYSINVENSLGLTTHSYILMDSHSYTDGDIFGILWKYDNIHANQVDWYKNTIEKINKSNMDIFNALGDDDKTAYLTTLGKDSLPIVQTSVFIHIPLVEYLDAWTEYKENGYTDTDNVKYISGVVGESKKQIYCGIGEDELFETILELGSTKNVFCGHDHLNNITLNYKGINLNYGMSIDYLAYIGIYKQTEQRGCVIITTKQNGDLVISKNKLTDYSIDK